MRLVCKPFLTYNCCGANQLPYIFNSLEGYARVPDVTLSQPQYPEHRVLATCMLGPFPICKDKNAKQAPGQHDAVVCRYAQ